MNWDNSTVLKFLELYQMNPCIWDPQNPHHKNRQIVNDAWIKIKDNLGLPCPIKDLKKKKESLMSAYRGYKTKIKKSETSGAGLEDIYKPTWFAFSFMDSFLSSVYVCKTTIKTEGQGTGEHTNTNTTSDYELDVHRENAISPSTSSASPSQHHPTPSSPPHRHTSIRQETRPYKRRQHNPELIEVKKQMDHAFDFMKNVQQPSQDDDESTVFGVLIAKKLRKLDEERRDIMMVKINQLFIDERQDNLRAHSAAIFAKLPKYSQ